MSPERRRRTVAEVRRRLGPENVSERRACHVLGQPRGTQRYRSRRAADEPRLLAEMRRLARQRPRFGCPRIHRLLVERDWPVNHKRVERIWRQEGLKVPTKQRKRGRLWLNAGSTLRLRPEFDKHVWSYDFMQDRTHDGKTFRILNIIPTQFHDPVHSS